MSDKDREDKKINRTISQNSIGNCVYVQHQPILNNPNSQDTE
jgi:hypothetical protein